ncbi:MAG: hypothetical protein CME68_00430 [Halobacteriovoraceae bacterium]|nr:hypothetical protein [Halobacteriovoraceae bacterium]|tara:strand:+ start:2140 stop:2730 length:591 start_codon:yes stop_codon:yes gene_type:complete
MSGELDTKKLKEEIRNVSLRRIKNHACEDSIVLEEANELEGDKSAVGQWLSLIFVASSAVKMSFKAYYYTTDANYFTSKALGLDSVDGVSKDQVDDFIKEFCNLVAGAIKESFELVGTKSLISLPLVTRGQDYVFFEVKETESNPEVLTDIWDLTLNDHTITCRIVFEIWDKEAMNKIDLLAFGAEDEDDGDIDFF